MGELLKEHLRTLYSYIDKEDPSRFNDAQVRSEDVFTLALNATETESGMNKFIILIRISLQIISKYLV